MPLTSGSPVAPAVSRTRTLRRSFRQLYCVGMRSLGSARSEGAGELRHLALLGLLDGVADLDGQRRVVALHLDGFHQDEVAEPLLQRALHQKLRGGGELRAVRREQQLQQAGAEGGAVDALARRGEEQLL